jgi:hypothetical protein
MTSAEIITAILGVGGLGFLIPKLIDGLRAWHSGRAKEERTANRSLLTRALSAENSYEKEITFRRLIEEWAGELVYMLKQIGVPTNKIPPKPERHPIQQHETAS